MSMFADMIRPATEGNRAWTGQLSSSIGSRNCESQGSAFGFIGHTIQFPAQTATQPSTESFFRAITLSGFGGYRRIRASATAVSLARAVSGALGEWAETPRSSSQSGGIKLIRTLERARPDNRLVAR